MIGLLGWVAKDIQIVVPRSLYSYGDFTMTKEICGTPQVRGRIQNRVKQIVLSTKIRHTKDGGVLKQSAHQGRKTSYS